MEVARRWVTLYPPRGSDRKPLKVTDAFLKLKAENVAWVDETRKRSSSCECRLMADGGSQSFG